MARIHLVGGEKGGVGKSLVARLLAQYCIDRSLPFLGFDADRSHGALLRFYADYASPVLVDRYESLDAIVEAAVDQPDRRLLIDLASHTRAPLMRWMDESQLLEVAAEIGLELVQWHVMDSGRDSVEQLRALFDTYGSRLDYVLVQNPVHGEDFGILERSGLLERARGLGAQSVTLPLAETRALNKLDEHGTSFWAATQLSPPPALRLGLLERQRLRHWQHTVYAQFDGIGI
jgi:hypothetical protein